MLGLGDRHPSNIMLDRKTGKAVHIDFGDCFEVAMTRTKLPEQVPFRLTRMLVNAMEVSGVEGNFRSTCEKVMAVLRQNAESVRTVLEAFVYDPLVNWSAGKAKTSFHEDGGADRAGIVERLPTNEKSPEDKSLKNVSGSEPQLQKDVEDQSKEKAEARNAEKNEEEVNLNLRNSTAAQLLKRIDDKLCGRDWSDRGYTDELNVQKQVDVLILEATSNYNLAQAYLGWSPFW